MKFLLLLLVISTVANAQTNQDMNSYIDEFFDSLYFENPSSRDIIKNQVKRKLSNIDVKSMADARATIDSMIQANNEKNQKLEEIINHNITELNFCMSIKGESEQVPKINSEKYSSQRVNAENFKTIVKMYSATEYQNGVNSGKLAEYSLKNANCAQELRTCMEERRGDPQKAIDHSLIDKGIEGSGGVIGVGTGSGGSTAK